MAKVRHERHVCSHSKELIKGYNLTYNSSFRQRKLVAQFGFLIIPCDRGLRLDGDGKSSLLNLALESKAASFDRGN